MAERLSYLLAVSLPGQEARLPNGWELDVTLQDPRLRGLTTNTALACMNVYCAQIRDTEQRNYLVGAIRSMEVEDLIYFAESTKLAVEISQLREMGPAPEHGDEGSFKDAIKLQLEECLKIMNKIRPFQAKNILVLVLYDMINNPESSIFVQLATVGDRMGMDPRPTLTQEQMTPESSAIQAKLNKLRGSAHTEAGREALVNILHAIPESVLEECAGGLEVSHEWDCLIKMGEKQSPEDIQSLTNRTCELALGCANVLSKTKTVNSILDYALDLIDAPKPEKGSTKMHIIPMRSTKKIVDALNKSNVKLTRHSVILSSLCKEEVVDITEDDEDITVLLNRMEQLTNGFKHTVEKDLHGEVLGLLTNLPEEYYEKLYNGKCLAALWEETKEVGPEEWF